MLDTTAIGLIEALPEEAKPVAFEHAVNRNPETWHAFRQPGDPVLRHFWPKSAGAMAEDRRQGKGPPFHKVDGRVYYTLFDIFQHAKKS